jgi:hypothetical protein
MRTSTKTVLAIVLMATLVACGGGSCGKKKNGWPGIITLPGFSKQVVEEEREIPDVAEIQEGPVLVDAGQPFRVLIAVAPIEAVLAGVEFDLHMDDGLRDVFLGPELRDPAEAETAGIPLFLVFDGLPPGQYRLDVIQVIGRGEEGQPVILEPTCESVLIVSRHEPRGE